MGLGRDIARDFSPSRKPTPGEMISTRGSMLVGTKKGYVDIAKLQADVDKLRAILGDKDFIDMLTWFKAAKAAQRSLGISEDDMSKTLF